MLRNQHIFAGHSGAWNWFSAKRFLLKSAFCLVIDIAPACDRQIIDNLVIASVKPLKEDSQMLLFACEPRPAFFSSSEIWFH